MMLVSGERPRWLNLEGVVLVSGQLNESYIFYEYWMLATSKSSPLLRRGAPRCRWADKHLMLR